MIADPPSLAGAVKDTLAWPSPAVAPTFVGAPGRAAGETEGDGTDWAESPTAFVACTVNV